MKKTNAIRILDTNNIKYDLIEYSTEGGIGGKDVAQKTGEDVSRVFKTLVTYSKDKEYFVFVLPSDHELDLKKAAKATHTKKIEMLPQKELFSLTGYVHGGCSPVGMKKEFPTVIHKSAEDYDYFFVSAGKVGMQMKVKPKDLVNLIGGKFENICKE
ncbi:Cys-tRNA(Pro) deacylase [Peptoniphilus raoultii]|uniref:Cys-tRNA(Pro) deacylase n=1 Tax=Peptoniphilus raoultii TaxID=1776387 RepID=UPI0008D8EFFE|nr:Cys-tRNA(Pro) deacylase [Peptoniphilus raoultii]